ncbi:sialate O-acetylesterase [Cognatitamlana onchidii]|uniref:sialate O-acetylesterase n=1 Tax=Cognatitamlana onchidii TaxID=2562860 RepID=UPI0010A64FCF|nr:sialate O-acetylesterase [Algibacter onchidii]
MSLPQKPSLLNKLFISILVFTNPLFMEYVMAEVKLPAIVSSNMVLQRNTTVTLWGWADAKEKISVELSWLNTPLKLEASEKGTWQINVETNNSRKPQTIKIKSDTSNLLLENVVFGEVWLCSGQSNMFQPMKGYKGQPTFSSTLTIAKSSNTKLRLFTVKKVGSRIPVENIEDYISWQQATPNNVANFSAVAYFFGQQLQAILDVPVGLIHTSWGASKIQAWMSKDALKPFQEVSLENANLKKANRIPTALFNAMIYPLVNYKIKGVLWYQGEGNRNEPENYKKLFPAMVKDWRTLWGLGDFPFYFVQIAPYWYNDNSAFQSVTNTAFMREAQLQCLDIIPNSGIAITMDIGDEYCIHPPKKKEVADRLLLNALHNTYGFETVEYTAPSYKSFELKDNSVVLKFNNVGNGLFTYDQLEGFEISGNDKVFYPAEAKIINGQDILVKSDKVTSPVAVRYAWSNWTKGSLLGTNLLPVSSFRTDLWNDNDATRPKKI